MVFKEFRNALCILGSIDRWELEEAGVVKKGGSIFKREETWKKFRRSPYVFFINSDHPTQKIIWSIIKRRM